jgi:hypothetical protein
VDIDLEGKKPAALLVLDTETERVLIPPTQLSPIVEVKSTQSTPARFKHGLELNENPKDLSPVLANEND